VLERGMCDYQTDGRITLKGIFGRGIYCERQGEVHRRAECRPYGCHDVMWVMRQGELVQVDGKVLLVDLAKYKKCFINLVYLSR